MRFTQDVIAGLAPVPKRLPFARGLFGLGLFAQQFLPGLGDLRLYLGDGEVIIARVDGQEHPALFEKATGGKGGMDVVDLSGDLGDQIDLGAGCDHALGVDIEAHGLRPSGHHLDHGQFVLDLFL
ncbi:MAG: hypothetical protein ACREXU_15845, partial [Gammaproteobacteria bacterium]